MFITVLLAAWLGGSTVVQYQDHKELTNLKQGYTQHEERLTNAEARLEAHKKAILALHNPKSATEAYRASNDDPIFGGTL